MATLTLVISPKKKLVWKREEEEEEKKKEEEEEEEEEEENEKENILCIGKIPQKPYVHEIPEDFKFLTGDEDEDKEKKKLKKKVTKQFDDTKKCDICWEYFPEEDTIRVNCHNRTTNTRRSTRSGEKIVCEMCQIILQVQKQKCSWCREHKIKWCTRKRTKKGDVKLRQQKIDLIKNIYIWREDRLKKYLERKRLPMHGDITVLQTCAIEYIRHCIKNSYKIQKFI